MTVRSSLSPRNITLNYFTAASRAGGELQLGLENVMSEELVDT